MLCYSNGTDKNTNTQECNITSNRKKERVTLMSSSYTALQIVQFIRVMWPETSLEHLGIADSACKTGSIPTPVPPLPWKEKEEGKGRGKGEREVGTRQREWSVAHKEVRPSSDATTKRRPLLPTIGPLSFSRTDTADSGCSPFLAYPVLFWFRAVD